MEKQRTSQARFRLQCILVHTCMARMKSLAGIEGKKADLMSDWCTAKNKPHNNSTSSIMARLPCFAGAGSAHYKYDCVFTCACNHATIVLLYLLDYTPPLFAS